MAIFLTLLWKEFVIRRRSMASLVLNIGIPIFIIALAYYNGNKEKPRSMLGLYTTPIVLSTTNQNLAARIKGVHQVPRVVFGNSNTTTECAAESFTSNLHNITEEVAADQVEAAVNNYTVGVWLHQWNNILAGVTSSSVYGLADMMPAIGVHLTSSGQNGPDLFRPEDDIKIKYYLGQSMDSQTFYRSLSVTHRLILLALQDHFLTEANATQRVFADFRLQEDRIFSPSDRVPPTGPIEQPLEKSAILSPIWLAIITTSHLCSRLMAEKSTKMRELLQMSGVGNLSYYGSFFVFDFPITLLVMFAIAPLALTYSLTEAAAMVWIILALYSTANTLFAIAFTTFFTRTSVCIVIYITVQFLTVVLTFFTSIENVRTTLIFNGYTQKDQLHLLIATFVSPTYAFELAMILYYFNESKGQFFAKRFFTTPNGFRLLTPATAILAMILSHLWWAFIIFYVGEVWPYQAGVPKPLCFPFMRSVGNEENSAKSKKSKDEKYFEADPTGLEADIEIRAVQKHFHGRNILKGIDFKVYHGQITVLLGHNGAGKTTLINIISGMYGASSGSVLVDNYDNAVNPSRARLRVGLCPQQNIHYGALTLYEHLYLFAVLKHFPENMIKGEIERVLNLIQLAHAAKYKAGTLSGGMKRRLQLGMALIGGSKILILDEPSSGLDIEARRAIWDMLLAVKRQHLIFLTTHHMEEAECLGDRVAIMHDGDIKSCGSTMFLKQVFGIGYTLRVLKGSTYNANAVQAFVSRHLKSARLDKEKKNEVFYLFNKEETKQLPSFFNSLEKEKNTIGIQSCGVMVTSLDDVFIKAGEVFANVATDGGKKLELSKTELEPTWKKCFRATFCKRWAASKRSKAYPVVFVITMALGIFFLRLLGLSKLHYLGRRFFSMDVQSAYNVTIKDDTLREVFNRAFPKHVNLPRGASPFHIQVNHVSNFTQICVHGWSGFSAVTNAYNVLYRFEMQNRTMGNLSVSTNDVVAIHSTPELFSRNLFVTFLPPWFLVPFILLLIPILIGEKNTNVKQLQMMTGMTAETYWLGNFAYDFIFGAILIFTWVFAAVIALFVYEIWTFFDSALTLVLVSLLFILIVMSAVSISYLFALFFQTTAAALIVATITFLVLPLAVFITHTDEEGSKRWLFVARLFPTVQFTNLVAALVAHTDRRYFCKDALMIQSDMCNWTPPEKLTSNYTEFKKICCSGTWTAMLNMVTEEGRQYETVAFVFLFMLASISMFVIAMYWYEKILPAMRRKIGFRAKLPKIEQEDSDVAAEREATAKVIAENKYTEKAMVVQNLTKVFSSRYAVNQLTFQVEKKECFGLLGVNGAGKTTAFRMLTGEIPASTGEAYIVGYSLAKDLMKARAQIGYCPQQDTFVPNLSAQEMLCLFARLRGVEEKDLCATVDNMVKLVDLQDHRYQIADTYSGGNKRKLAIGIALIGFPPLVFLDEPTAAVDPVARRKIWFAIETIRATTGSAIVITSHAMDECESLCDRIVVMVLGQFKCLGSFQRLKDKFAQGFTVTVKIKPGQNMDIVSKRLLADLPGAQVRDAHNAVVSFRVPAKTATIGGLYEVMEKVNASGVLEDYTVSETNLEEIFLGLARANQPIANVAEPVQLAKINKSRVKV